MALQTLETHFASADRSTAEEIQRRFERLNGDVTLTTVLDAMPQLVAILDQNRQIVAVNSALLQTFESEDLDTMLGNRPGELLGCRQLDGETLGCGTTEACRHCGAVRAILESQELQRSVSHPCHLTVGETREAMDLRVTASPLQIAGEHYTVLSIHDMADENRREVLERTFFHDVLNAAGGALGIARELSEAETLEEVREFAPLLVMVTDQMVEEIRSQQDMLAAERGDLEVRREEFGTVQFLMEVLGTYNEHPVTEGRNLELANTSQDRLVHTSKALLHRVLGNMVKNALEATEVGGTVRLGCSVDSNELCFWVNNPDVMPRSVQLQVFNRSFSTKGSGRGIGTYSIRLLGERYLGGRVSFDSHEDRGTTFRIHLPAERAARS